MSGPSSCQIGLKLFRKPDNSRLSKPESHRIYFGRIISPKQHKGIDEVLISFFKGPKSYTGDDVVEISAHGGRICLTGILEAAILAGARSALPGEFTRRAFINGRLDLSQAEAVDDLISARTSRGAELAWNQLTGENRKWLDGIERSLTRIIADLTAELEFPDDIGTIDKEHLAGEMRTINEKITKAIRSSKPAVMIREGVRLAIVGRVNVGKSTMFNALLGRDRAITSHLPGTTRDFIEESLDIDGIPVTLIDTAGWLIKKDSLDKKSWQKTSQSIHTSSLVIFVVDATTDLKPEDRKIWRLISDRRDRVIVALNKIDNKPMISQGTISQDLGKAAIVAISALKRRGLNDLKKAIGKMLIDDAKSPTGTALFGNYRHLSCLKTSQAHLKKAIANLGQTAPLDIIALDLRQAWEKLGEITGQTATRKLLDNIFSRFCLGK